MGATRRLYHFTAPVRSHLGEIIRERRLRLSESNVRLDGSGPRVVWLTKEGEKAGEWINGLPLSHLKAGARITLDVPAGEAFAWEGWARRKGMAPLWMRALAKAGGDPENWYVIEREIVAAEFVEIRFGEHVLTGDDMFGADARLALAHHEQALRKAGV